jgi:hypothetical protein
VPLGDGVGVVQTEYFVVGNPQALLFYRRRQWRSVSA